MPIPAIDQGTAIMLLGGLTGTSSFTATSGSLSVHLTINAPTATVNGTALSGTGSTPLPVTWTTPTGTSSGAISTNTNTMTWTNGGASTWNVVGCELWDATPVRKFYGIFAGQPFTVGPSSQFVLAASSLSVSFP